MTTTDSFLRARLRRGITLTEILIAILILAVGLASLATLFPLGLLRLRDAARSTRSAYLTESAASDMTARGLLTTASFSIADQFNINYPLTTITPWYTIFSGPKGSPLPYPFSWSPTTQDTGYYGDDPRDSNFLGVTPSNSGGYGLPFAYDPLWRYQTQNPASNYGAQGYYLNDGPLEARFGAGLGFIQNDPFDGGIPSAHGLQRITNFTSPYAVNAAGVSTPVMPIATTVPSIFVSPEDVVWVENVASNQFSPVLPDMTLNPDNNNNPSSINDWHYSWMFTGQQNNSSAASTFDGNFVVFENRPFGINVPSSIPNAPGGNYQAYEVDGETVVEAIWGYSTSVASAAGPKTSPGFGVSADRAVLLRWCQTQTDPVVHVGDWIADVTYERNANTVATRFMGYTQYVGVGGAAIPGSSGGLQNPYNNLEWDNLPAQRCFWYRVQKVMAAIDDQNILGFGQTRSMVVYVDRTLQARTPLNTSGQPYSVNAALICPYVVNVVPQTIFTH
jgi:type II secretory pathway pseudopilin PulG